MRGTVYVLYLNQADEDKNTFVHTQTHTQMVTVAFFPETKGGKRYKCPSVRYGATERHTRMRTGVKYNPSCKTVGKSRAGDRKPATDYCGDVCEALNILERHLYLPVCRGQPSDPGPHGSVLRSLTSSLERKDREAYDLQLNKGTTKDDRKALPPPNSSFQKLRELNTYGAFYMTSLDAAVPFMWRLCLKMKEMRGGLKSAG